ncbi:MAG: hypothetical protein WA814_04265, partial [Candidatus Baltobacteraceae bacterium]
PYALHGAVLYGHLNKKSTMFAAGNFSFSAVDVYYYSPQNVTYLYSFSNGISVSADVEGVAFNPRSDE